MHTAIQYRRMLTTVTQTYVEFSRPPFAVDPLDEQLVKDAARRGVRARLLIEAGQIDAEHREHLREYQQAGVEIRSLDRLPLKLALFDGYRGLVALLDPVLTRPSWTSLVFEHDGFAEAMAGLFESYWTRGTAEMDRGNSSALPANAE
jgi:HTH-type transcriptional regulator, sugar sensing transcriptional regulator